MLHEVAVVEMRSGSVMVLGFSSGRSEYIFFGEHGLSEEKRELVPATIAHEHPRVVWGLCAGGFFGLMALGLAVGGSTFALEYTASTLGGWWYWGSLSLMSGSAILTGWISLLFISRARERRTYHNILRNALDGFEPALTYAVQQANV